MQKDLLEIITEISGEGNIDFEDELFNSGLIDSLGFIELLAAIEEKFGITIDPLDVDKEDVNTINKLAAFLESRNN